MGSNISLFLLRHSSLESFSISANYVPERLLHDTTVKCSAEVRIPQCGNFRIFLPIRFYVKSRLENAEPQELPISLIERLWILIFFNFCTLRRLKLAKNQNFVSKIAKNGSYSPNTPKLISRDGKIMKFPHCVRNWLIFFWCKLISRKI